MGSMIVVLVQQLERAIMGQHQWNLVQQKSGEEMVVRMPQEGDGMVVEMVGIMVGIPISKTIGLVSTMVLLLTVALVKQEICLG